MNAIGFGSAPAISPNPAPGRYIFDGDHMSIWRPQYRHADVVQSLLRIGDQRCWLASFPWRFFSEKFKRSPCLTDGGSGVFSPRPVFHTNSRMGGEFLRKS